MEKRSRNTLTIIIIKRRQGEREREKEREREREREKEREKGMDRQTNRQTDRERRGAGPNRCKCTQVKHLQCIPGNV